MPGSRRAPARRWIAPGVPQARIRPRAATALQLPGQLGRRNANSSRHQDSDSLYFKSGCEQQPSPNARETRPQRGRVFRFVRSVFEGWARVVGAAVSRSLNRRVARLPRWPTEWAESLSGSLAAQGAGLRVGRSRWSGHYPRGRPRWFSPEPLRTATRGCCLRSRGGEWCVQVRGQ